MGSFCNIAFVNERSPLMMRLKYAKAMRSDVNIGDELVWQIKTAQSLGKAYIDEDYLLKHGFWTLLPVSIPSFSNKNELHKLTILPKLSPGYFFSVNTKYALFAESDVMFRNPPSLLQVMKSQPASAGLAGDTIMMFGTKAHHQRSSSTISLQERAYNSMRIALGERMGIPLSQYLDTSWMIHALSSSDAHMLRCDMYSEANKWGSSSKNDLYNSIEFILSLNDFWSSMLVSWNDVMNDWWQRQREDAMSTNFVPKEGEDKNEAISMDLGQWLAIPSNGKFNFVRLVPSIYVLEQPNKEWG